MYVCIRNTYVICMYIYVKYLKKLKKHRTAFHAFIVQYPNSEIQ